METMAAHNPTPADASSDAPSDIGPALAARIRLERTAREWSMDELSRRAGVSRAMISKIEREECSPTATILGRLSGAFGISMSALLAHAEAEGRRLLRFEDQQVWIDPGTKYLRRAVSPGAGAPLQLVEVELPPRARLTFPASAYSFLHQQIWILSGRLLFSEGPTVYDLRKGDCLQLGYPQECTYENPSASVKCRYLVAVIVQARQPHGPVSERLRQS
jgi:transcriptional regulator with XRE-family HTH domain